MLVALVFGPVLGPGRCRASIGSDRPMIVRVDVDELAVLCTDSMRQKRVVERGPELREREMRQNEGGKDAERGLGGSRPSSGSRALRTHAGAFKHHPLANAM